MRVCLHVPGAQPRVLLDTADVALFPVTRIDTGAWGPGYSVFFEGERDATRPLFLGWGVILSTPSPPDDEWVVLADDGRTSVAFDDTCLLANPADGSVSYLESGPKQVFNASIEDRVALKAAWGHARPGHAELLFVIAQPQQK